MRSAPTWRIPVGVLALVAVLGVYSVLVASFAPSLIGDWPALAQAPVYVVFGVVWLLPLRRFLIWMETGHWG